MKSLRERSLEIVQKTDNDKDSTVRIRQENLISELTSQVQQQRLMILDLEEHMGAIAQEKEWLYNEISHLKAQVAELEHLIFSTRLVL